MFSYYVPRYLLIFLKFVTFVWVRISADYDYYTHHSPSGWYSNLGQEATRIERRPVTAAAPSIGYSMQPLTIT